VAARGSVVEWFCILQPGCSISLLLLQQSRIGISCSYKFDDFVRVGEKMRES